MRCRILRQLIFSSAHLSKLHAVTDRHSLVQSCRGSPSPKLSEVFGKGFGNNLSSEGFSPTIPHQGMSADHGMEL